MVPDVGIEIIQDAMNKKATRLPSYRQECDSVWLLLGSSGLYPHLISWSQKKFALTASRVHLTVRSTAIASKARY
jgi:hypothetical protein